ncbi:hypothetical protein ACFFGV_04540 [Pontibacillus salicampi]|uniref:DUF4025 domain-containing protein n=1 Tax=Pontibacillus salicampi TaxID=1449801 RepID=A0ABV6LKJ6_9BACI
MGKYTIKREFHNELAEAFNANTRISKAFNSESPHDGGDGEGELLSNYYMNNNTAAVDITDNSQPHLEDERNKHKE